MKELKLIEIQEQFNKVISHAEGNNFKPNTDALFDDWYENKKRFIDAFGGLIYEVETPVIISLDERAKANKVNNFIDDLYRVNGRLGDFVWANRTSFFDNEVTSLSPSTPTQVKKGMKLFKAFKYFIEDEQELRDLQDRASMIIQENKTTGKLCFSVHPLDFLSISENDHNWRSCHALDGEYRAGNLSLMVDKSTFIAYIKSDKGDIYTLPRFHPDVKWNSKKWRVLMHTNEDFSFFITSKQYPFSSDELFNNDTIRQHIFEAFHLRHPFNYSEFINHYINTFKYPDSGDEYYLRDKYLCFKEKLYGLKSIIKDGAESKAYNDILHASYDFSPYYFGKNYGGHDEPGEIHIGGPVLCLACGQDTLCTDDSYLCEDCELDFGHSESEDFAYCAICDTRMREVDATYISERGYICSDCFHSEEIVECDDCGTYLLLEDAKTIDGEGHYCYSCYYDRT